MLIYIYTIQALLSSILGSCYTTFKGKLNLILALSSPKTQVNLSSFSQALVSRIEKKMKTPRFFLSL